MKTKMFSFLAGVGFFASAISEYGLGQDFPLTSSLWLVIAAVMFFATTTQAALTTNFWSDSNGRWETATNWSAGVPSTNGQSAVVIAGGGSIAKSIIIDATTVLSNAVNQCMTVSNLTVVGVTAPVITNSLSLQNAGTATPLRILNSLVITGGPLANVSITNSAMTAASLSDDGFVTLNSGTLIVTNGFSSGGVAVGNLGQGVLTILDGTAFANFALVGVTASSQGTLTVAGGTNTLSSTALSFSLVLGTTAGSTGTVWMTGGQLTVTNNEAMIGSVGLGQMTVSNGTWLARDVVVGQGSGSRGTLIVAGGTTTVFSNMTLGSFDCTSTGIVNVVGGELDVTNTAGDAVLEVRSGTLIQTGGVLRVDVIVVTNSCAHFIHTGGTLLYGGTDLDPNADADGDGMPNGFERFYHLDPFDPSDAGLDNDCDGVSNLQEFLNNTNPNVNPLSKDGFHNACGFTTGGEGGPVVTVTDFDGLTNYVAQSGPYVIAVKGTINLGTANVHVAANKTIAGLGTNATLIGDLKMDNGSNLIVRNLSFTNPTHAGDGDGLTIQRSHHIWVDHCTFYDCADGEFDMTHAADYITVSRCKFYYTSNTGHNFVNLVGHDDNNAAEDTGKLHVTFHHNWWSTLCVERMPRIRYGRVHSYNNYFNNSVNGVIMNLYCIRAGLESQVRIENNYFDHVQTPFEKFITTGTPGLIEAIGNILVNFSNQSDPGVDLVFTPPYVYTLDNATNVPNSVTNNAGAGKLGPAGSAFEQWQLLYFACTNCSQAAATSDPDGDGMDNNAEFLTGTDPTDNGSSFRIASIAVAENDIRAAWTMGPGKTNALERSPGDASGSYSNSFIPVFTVTNTVGTWTNYLDVGAATNFPARYYRVRLVP